MVAYTKPQQRKKEESEQLRGERDQIKFIDLRIWQNFTKEYSLSLIRCFGCPPIRLFVAGVRSCRFKHKSEQ